MPAVSPRAPSLPEARGEAHQPRAPGRAGRWRRVERWLRNRAGLLLDALHEGPRLAAAGLHLALRLAAVALDDASRLGAALAQLALDLRTGALDLAQRAVTSGVATALVLAQVGRNATLHLALHLAELALRALAGDGVRLDDLEHLVTRRKGGADGDQHGALGLRLNDLKRVQLGLGAGLGGPAGGLAALGSVATAGGSGLAGRGLPLSLCLGGGGHGSFRLSFPTDSGLRRGSY